MKQTLIILAALISLAARPTPWQGRTLLTQAQATLCDCMTAGVTLPKCEWPKTPDRVAMSEACINYANSCASAIELHWNCTKVLPFDVCASRYRNNMIKAKFALAKAFRNVPCVEPLR